MKRIALLFALVALTVASGCASVTPARVAVIDFENLTADTEYDHVEGAIAEYLTTHLANSGVIRLCDRQDIYNGFAMIDLAKSEKERYARWRRLGKKIGADYLVGGSISRLEGSFILTGRVFNVRRGEIIPGSAATEARKQGYEIYYSAQKLVSFLATQLLTIGALQEPGAR